MEFDKLTSEMAGESSREVKFRVQGARDIQLKRFSGLGIFTNSEMRSQHLKEFCKVDKATLDLLKNAVNQMKLSARSYHRILKIARTIADLADDEHIQLDHISEAIQYRPKME